MNGAQIAHLGNDLIKPPRRSANDDDSKPDHVSVFGVPGARPGSGFIII